MAIITTSGRTALAIALRSKSLHLAWGTGSPAWDAAPVQETLADAALIAEIGRRTIFIVQFCKPDAAGDIAVPGGTFIASESPTHYLYLRVSFDYADAASSIIREVAVFSGTQTISGLPAGQAYFTPAQIALPGTLLAIERFPPIVRSATIRQSFDFVINI